MPTMASSSKHTLDDGTGPSRGGSGSSIAAGDDAAHVDMATYIDERRKQRLRRDPHYEHPLSRIYIGPSPVSSNSAAKVAAVMRHDVMQERGHKRWYRHASHHHKSPTEASAADASNDNDYTRQGSSLFPPPPIALGVVGGTGTIIGATLGWRRRSGGSQHDPRWTQGGAAKTEASAMTTQNPLTATSQSEMAEPNSRARGIGPPSPARSRLNTRSASVDVGIEAQKSRDEPHSYRLPSSVEQSRHVSNETRRASSIGGGILRHTRSAEMNGKRSASPKGLDDTKVMPASAPSDNVKFAHNLQHSRRQQSEQLSPVQGASTSGYGRRRASDGIPATANDDSKTLPLLNEPVTEEEDVWVNEDDHGTEDARERQQLKPNESSDNRALRQMGSQRSLGMRAPAVESSDGHLMPGAVARLRNSVVSTGSAGNESPRNSIIIHSNEASSESQAAEFGRLKPDSAQARPSASLAPPSDPADRGEKKRARARQQFQQSKAGQSRLGLPKEDTAQNRNEESEKPDSASPLTPGFRAPASRGRQREHTRNMSKLSHMSHASTINSVGTRFSEGSFGASGGFRARMMRVLGAGHSDEETPGRQSQISQGSQRSASGISGFGTPSHIAHRKRAASRAASLSSQAIRAIARSHGGRAHVRGGVVAGAVGTSAGGTKWVGQSFSVGQRFAQATMAREAQLLATEYEAKFAQKPIIKEPAADAMQSTTDSTQDLQRVGKLSDRSPSQVLDAFARRAETVEEERIEQARKKASVDSAAEAHEAKARVESDETTHDQSTPALVGSSFGSDTSDRLPATPPRTQPGAMPLDRMSDTRSNGQKGHEQSLVVPAPEASASRESLVSMPQDTTVTGDIENRHGWADIMGFINGKTRTKKSNEHLRARERHEASADTEVAKAKEADTQDTVPARTSSPDLLEEEPATAALTELQPEGATPGDEQPSDAVQRPANRREYSTAASSMGATFVSALSSASASSDGAMMLSGQAKTMSTQQALTHPEPPMAAEEKFPEATHELTRRVSNPGVAPHGGVNDTASDHEVVVHQAHARGIPCASEERPGLPQRSATANNDQPLVSALMGQSHASEGMRKTVQFKSGDVVHGGQSAVMRGGRERQRVIRGDAKPAHPHEVLARSSEPTSGAHKEMLEHADGFEEPITSRSILKRDRMLVRVAWTPSEDLPRELTEHESRKYPLYFNDPFREYMVVYRMGRLELWDDPSWAMWLSGRSDQLKLHLIAPLKPGRTFMSLYSPIDNVFCISFQLGPGHHRGLLNLRKSGTHVWIFDARSVTLAADWMWELWRELGGHIPPVLDVSLPVIGVKIQLPIPDQIRPMENGSISLNSNNRALPSSQSATSGELIGEGYKLITRENVVRVVQDLACQVPRWGDLTKKLQERGVSFGLAWRVENKLQWVQYDDTADGQRRDWAVLVGSILCNARAHSSLEFRAAIHYAHDVHMASGARLAEPPAIEGYLWRVKAVSGSLTRVYVSTHDGLLFVSRPSRAYPPERFVAADPMMGEVGSRSRRRSSAGGDESLSALGRRVFDMLTGEPKTLDDVDAQVKAYRTLERRRQFEQVSHADGYVDVRDIVLIRCLGGNGPEGRPTGDGNDDDMQTSFVDSDEEIRSQHGSPSTTDSDAEEEDVGGEEGYELADDRHALKQGRQIEVTMTNGRSIRLEAYSRSVACEWVQRLTAISRYWKRREKIDALEMMDASGYDANFMTRHSRKMHGGAQKHTEPCHNDRMAPLLGSIWNWCVLDGCRGIVRSGRLFTKKKPYSAFTSRYCVLVGGRILTYKLMTSNRTARSRQNAGIFHKRQETVIHLRDAYVYSGKLTEHMLVNGRTQGAGAITGTGGSATGTTRHTLPRIYGDGLQSVDEDEDCTFVIRYRPQRVQPTSSAAALEASLRTAGLAGTQPPDGPTHTVNPMTPGDTTAAAGAATSVRPPTAAGAIATEPRHKHAMASHVQQASSASAFASTQLLHDKTVNQIAMRARSRLERDLWVWAIDCERERVVREDREREEHLRQQGKTPWKPH